VHGGIAAGADGKLWFDFRQCNSHLTGGIFRECDPVVIDKITSNAAITGFQFSGSAFCSSVGRLTAGPDGNVWFTDPCANKIGRITTSGVITEFAIPGPSVGAIGGIVAGPDHNLWFIAPKGSALVDATLKVDRVTTTSGVITEYAIPAPALRPNGVYCTDSIAPGPDGTLWFTECGANRIGRITTEGNITEFPIPTLNSLPAGITTGPDGNVWFTESSADQLGRITMTGAVTEFPVRTPNSSPGDITSGPGGTLWFTESSVNKIGRITP
jgi:streptogramin lyase